MSMYDLFQTDESMEAEGVWLDYGPFRIKVAAAGQGNNAYVKYAEKKLKPVRRALDAGALGNKRANILMADIYAKTIVKGWEVKDDKPDAEWESGIHDKDGNTIEFSQENVEKTLIALPRLFTDVQEQAGAMSNFQQEGLDEDSGNS